MDYYPPNDHGSTDVRQNIELYCQLWNYKNRALYITLKLAEVTDDYLKFID